MKIVINDIEYEVIENNNAPIDEELLKEMLTDYFQEFDYILGDYAYSKLRLKGFNEKDNKNYKNINAFENIHEYIEKYCAYGCKYFILKQIRK